MPTENMPTENMPAENMPAENMPAPPVPTAVIGGGTWGRNHVRVLSELGVLAAVADTDPVVAGEHADRHGVPARTVQEILDDATIPAVVVASPAATHVALARAALEAGKHVLVEKPLALTVEEGEGLVELAATSPGCLMVGHLLHYHPAFLALRTLVDDGSLGTVHYLYSTRLNLGKIRREENILWSFAPHDLSMVLALLGDRPDRVSAVGARYLQAEVADVTTTHLRFASGQQAHVFVSWLHPFKQQKLVVVGDRAMAVFDDLEDWESKLVVYAHQLDWRDGLAEPRRADGHAVPLDEREPLREELVHFLECAATGQPPRTDAAEGLAVLRVLDAAERSMRAGGAPVDLFGARPPEGEAHPEAFVHPSAWIDDGVELGAGTKVWHFCHVLSGSRIGRDCSLGQNVVVGPDVAIGDGCRIQNNVSVYAGVTLEDDVFCGPSCVFTNVVNPRAEISRADEFRPTVVRRGATIGANATVVCGHTIGAYAFVAAGAVVTADVPAHALVAGVPARRIGWVSRSGARLGDDLVCPETGRRYRETPEGGLEEAGDR